MSASNTRVTGTSRNAGADTSRLLQLDHVSVRFGGGRSLLGRSKTSVTAVDDVSFSVDSGQTLGIVGATGSGKSTIARLIMGMVTPIVGSVVLAGHNLASIGPEEQERIHLMRQIVLQDPRSSLNPRMRIGDIIVEPLMVLPEMRKKSARPTLDQRAEELLSMVGLPASRARLYPHQLSGGQLQRVSIARALAPSPSLIVLDEPTSALDVSVRAQVLSLLKSLQERLGVTYLIISHDLVTVAYLATEIAVMHLGRIVESGPTEGILTAPLHPYSQELLTSVPTENGQFLERLESTSEPQEIPASACRYAARCSLRITKSNPAECWEIPPPLREVEKQHKSACHFAEEMRSPLIRPEKSSDVQPTERNESS